MKILSTLYSTLIQPPVEMVSSFCSRLKNVTLVGFSALATLFNSLKNNIRSLFNRVSNQQDENSLPVAEVANRVLATSNSSTVPTVKVSLPQVSQEQFESLMAQLSRRNSLSPLALASPSHPQIRLNVRLSDSTEPLIYLLDKALFRRMCQLPEAQMIASTFFLEDEASQDTPNSNSSGIASRLSYPTQKEKLENDLLINQHLLSEAQLPMYLFLEGDDIDFKLNALHTQ